MLLLHEKSVDEVVAKLMSDELGHVIRLVSRCPTCYRPGTLVALRSQTPAPLRPSVSTSNHQPLSRRPGRIIAKSLHGLRFARAEGAATRAMPTYARTFEHPQSKAKLAIKPNPEKAGTSAGTLAETVRRRFAVADLMKAGLSVRAISAGTGIPRSSVHRAMAAIVRAQAKQEVAIAEMAKEFLCKRLSRRG